MNMGSAGVIFAVAAPAFYGVAANAGVQRRTRARARGFIVWTVWMVHERHERHEKFWEPSEGFLANELLELKRMNAADR